MTETQEIMPNVKLVGISVKIDAPPPFGGEYLLQPRGSRFFTNHEFHLIKVETAIKPMAFDQAWADDDPDVGVALALVALDRAGKPVQSAKKLIGALTPDCITFEQVVEPDPEQDEKDAMLPPESSPAAES